MKNSEYVLFPRFELVGPHCLKLGCEGILVDHVNLKTKEIFMQCSVCNMIVVKTIKAE